MLREKLQPAINSIVHKKTDQYIASFGDQVILNYIHCLL